MIGTPSVAGTRRQATRGMVLLARSGYAARGLVYLVVGYFAVRAAQGSGANVSPEGAVRQLLGGPYGQALMWGVAIGLFGFAAWRLVQAVADTDDHGSDAKGLVVRAALVGSAVVNALLALFALSLVSAWDTGSGSGGGTDPLSRLLGVENSNLAIYAVALVPLGVAIAHFVKAWRAGFERYFECPAHVMRIVRPVSQVGIAARGVVFLVIAVLLFVGGSRYEPTDPPGIKEALDALEGMPFGGLLLGAIGLGLAAFAVYSFAQARWRRIDLRQR